MIALHGFATTATRCWADTGWLRRIGRERDVVLVELPWHVDERLAREASGVADLGAADGPHGVDAADVPGADVPGADIAGPAEAPDPDDGPASRLSIHDLLDTLSEVAERVAESAGTGRLDLLGYSFGARLAWELAVQEPGLVRRVAVGGLPAGDPLADLAGSVGPPDQRDRAASSPSAPGSATVSASVSTAASYPASSAPASAAEAVRELMDASDLPRAGLEAFVRAFGGARFSPRPAPAQPVLMALGDADRVAAGGAELSGLLGPGSRFLDLPGRTHVDALTSGVFARAVLAHFDAARRACG